MIIFQILAGLFFIIILGGWALKSFGVALNPDEELTFSERFAGLFIAALFLGALVIIFH